MKYLSLFFISVLCFSQSLTTVSVGGATEVTEKIIFLAIGCNSKSDIDVNSIIDKDFNFYQEKLRADLRSSNTSFSNNLKKILSDGYTKLVELNCSKRTIDIFNTRLSSKLSSLNYPTAQGNIRRHAHQIADSIYRSLYNKKSLFSAQITFASSGTSRLRSTKKELFVMDFDGGNLRQLTNHGGIVLSPAFSHDNSRIVYSLIKPGTRDIVLYEFDLNSNSTSVLLDRKGLIIGAVYTADGSGIYLTISPGRNADIYYLNRSTKALKRVTSHPSSDVDPSINYLGNLMTFLSGRSGKANIYTVNPLVGGTPKRISYVGKFNATPRFSPDGREIVFSSWVDGTFDIYRIYSNGTGLVRLSKNFGSNESPTYSPEGEFIAFSSKRVISRVKADQNVYIMTRLGKILGPVTANIGHCTSPRFSN